MLIKQLFLSAALFSILIFFSFGYASDKECRSYIITSTEKICLSSGDEYQDEDTERADMAIPPQGDNSVMLQESLEYGAESISEPIGEVEVGETWE